MIEKSEYVNGTWLLENLALKSSELLVARKNGFPCLVRGKYCLYKLSDIHDYYSGRIGKDVEGKK